MIGSDLLHHPHLEHAASLQVEVIAAAGRGRGRPQVELEAGRLVVVLEQLDPVAIADFEAVARPLVSGTRRCQQQAGGARGSKTDASLGDHLITTSQLAVFSVSEAGIADVESWARMRTRTVCTPT